MRVSAVQRAQQFIRDRTRLVLKKRAVFRQHRDVSEVSHGDYPVRRVKVVLTQEGITGRSYRFWVKDGLVNRP
jgi:hypothetical protein